MKRGFYCVKQEGERVKETGGAKNVAKLLDNNINGNIITCRKYNNLPQL